MTQRDIQKARGVLSNFLNALNADDYEAAYDYTRCAWRSGMPKPEAVQWLGEMFVSKFNNYSLSKGKRKPDGRLEITIVHNAFDPGAHGGNSKIFNYADVVRERGSEPAPGESDTEDGTWGVDPYSILRTALLIMIQEGSSQGHPREDS